LRLVVWSLAAALSAGALASARAEERSLEAQLREHRGRIVVVNFWAAWCAPCRRELPLLARLQREYDARGVRFVGASTDAPEALGAAEALLARAGVAYPTVFGRSEAEMRTLGLGSALPATAVFDRDGARAFRLVGNLEKKRLVERLEWLLGTRDGHPPKELLLPAGVNARDYGH
jgi:thiol-disulfide isomerase/thioredoxin